MWLNPEYKIMPNRLDCDIEEWIDWQQGHFGFHYKSTLTFTYISQSSFIRRISLIIPVEIRDKRGLRNCARTSAINKPTNSLTVTISSESLLSVLSYHFIDSAVFISFKQQKCPCFYLREQSVSEFTLQLKFVI